jgi:1,4-dihydroxy-2-naphthoate octaprenyltransferase
MLATATKIALAGAALAALPLLWANTAPALLAAALLVLGVLALGYSATPLRLSWRGLGEVDVALTHSLGAMGWGLMVQGGSPLDAALWALALPLGLAILPAIILSGVPDRDADEAAGKRTLAVRWGCRGARRSAALSLVATNCALWATQSLPATFGALAGLWPWVALHSLLLLGLLYRPAAGHAPERIDGILVVALTLILWFVAFPLWRMA